MPQCMQPNKTFARPCFVRRHEMTAHNDNRLKFPCQICQVVFSREDLRRRHLLAHNGEGSAECKHCGNTFRKDYATSHQLKYRPRLASNEPSKKVGLPERLQWATPETAHEDQYIEVSQNTVRLDIAKADCELTLGRLVQKFQVRQGAMGHRPSRSNAFMRMPMAVSKLLAIQRDLFPTHWKSSWSRKTG